MKYTEIQTEIIKKYRVDLCDGTRCKDGDWTRTHAHPKQRRVCKWKQANSIQSTFTLLHEVGHIETTTSKMRRAESEYYATLWALERCKEYGIEVPEKIIKEYQDYIDDEKARGLRRGGSGYAELKLVCEKKKKSTTTRADIIRNLEEIKELIAETDADELTDYARENAFMSVVSAIDYIEENFE